MVVLTAGSDKLSPEYAMPAMVVGNYGAIRVTLVMGPGFIRSRCIIFNAGS